jgi:hypothetical protein
VGDGTTLIGASISLPGCEPPAVSPAVVFDEEDGERVPLRLPLRDEAAVNAAPACGSSDAVGSCNDDCAVGTLGTAAALFPGLPPEDAFIAASTVRGDSIASLSAAAAAVEEGAAGGDVCVVSMCRVGTAAQY